METEVGEDYRPLLPSEGHALQEGQAALLHQEGYNARGGAGDPGIAVNENSIAIGHALLHKLNSHREMSGYVDIGHI